jgi:hypothetical protein
MPYEKMEENDMWFNVDGRIYLKLVLKGTGSEGVGWVVLDQNRNLLPVFVKILMQFRG